MWRAITVEQFNELRHKVVIDVRSPCEHVKENIPGSINVPLLSDEERDIVGTIYATEGEMAARRHAVRIISPKIPELVDLILSLKMHSHALVVHCWRGGLRSETVVSFLSIVGVDSFRLTGGYKAWRQSVLADFETDTYAFKTIVLAGLTGCGKTEILRELNRLGEFVLDLEALANHRGSIFGGIGMAAQPTQKNFEGALWSKLQEWRKPVMFVEAESRKIGQLAVPTFLLNRMKGGQKILVEGSLEARCRRILTEYSASADQEAIVASLESLAPLKERLGKEKLDQLSEFLRNGMHHQFVEMLLLDYYDPMYKQYSSKNQFSLAVSGDDPARAATQIREWVSSVMLQARSL